MNKHYSTAGLMFIHVLMLIAGSFVLVAFFDFPEVLRLSSELRLEKFLQQQHLIVPTYYVLVLTGLTQILIAVLVNDVFDSKNSWKSLALTFGVLCGLCQILGFIRWPVLIPYLANSNADTNSVALLEGAFNHYLGMTVGEHLGFLFQGLWTLFFSLALLQAKNCDKRLSYVGVFVSIGLVLISLEPLSPKLSYLSALTRPTIGLWSLWLMYVAIAWIKIPRAQGSRVHFGWLATSIGSVLGAVLSIRGVLAVM